MGCVILKCNCKSSYQDKRYGKGKRVHNEGQGKTRGAVYCTVCGNKKSVG